MVELELSMKVFWVMFDVCALCLKTIHREFNYLDKSFILTKK